MAQGIWHQWYLTICLQHNNGTVMKVILHTCLHCTFVHFLHGIDLSVDNLNMEYMNAGLYFPRNRDIDGKVILIMKSKLHIRGLRNTEQLIRGFIYWIERLNR